MAPKLVIPVNCKQLQEFHAPATYYFAARLRRNVGCNGAFLESGLALRPDRLSETRKLYNENDTLRSSVLARAGVAPAAGANAAATRAAGSQAASCYRAG
jgi:hypothetical protein